MMADSDVQWDVELGYGGVCVERNGSWVINLIKYVTVFRLVDGNEEGSLRRASMPPD